MKQQTTFGAIVAHRRLIWLVFAAQLIVSSCSIFQKNKVPSSYGTVRKPAPSNTQVARVNYIDRYKTIAIKEMERTGVPASITLAQGLLESDAGRSELSANYNNHFGIKCHSDWTGPSFYKEDDDIDPLTGKLMKSCFRAYNNGEESFVAHSEFLRDPRKVNRYGQLFTLPKNDYVGWANGLLKSGYATAPDYADKLIGLVEDYQLAQYDNYASTDPAANLPSSVSGGQQPYNPSASQPTYNPNGTYTPPTNNTYGQPTANPYNPNQPVYGSQPTYNPSGGYLPSGVNVVGATPNGGQPTGFNQNGGSQPTDTEGSRNDVKYIRSAYGQTLYEVAGKAGMRVTDLQDYNEEIGDPNLPLEAGTIVYTQRKRNYWRGTEKYHVVKDCETMFTIAQFYGMKLSKLYSKNAMREGEQPAVRERLVLRRGWFEGEIGRAHV